MSRQENKFLAMWDCNGLECLFDITDLEGDAMFAALKDEPFKTPFNLSMLMLRARFNSHRSYEIYTFSTVDVDYDQVVELFQNSPQLIVDLIREKGRKIFSDYSKQKKVIE